MKFNFSRIIFFVSVVAFLSSCLNSSDTTSTSTDANFYSLKFASDDSVPGISSTSFKLIPISDGSKDSMITNIDSIAYNSDVNDVIATFSFKASNGAYYIYGDKNETHALSSGSDTIDFNRKPLYVVNYVVVNKDTTRVKYLVDVRVHKADPKLFMWSKLQNTPNFHDDAINHKLLAIGDVLYYFANTGTKAYVNISSDEGQSWKETELSNFPMNASLTDMTVFGDQMYVAGDGKYYRSTDGINWGEFSDADYKFSAMICPINNQLWAISKSNADSKYRFATTSDGLLWTIRGEIPNYSTFPVKDFTASGFYSKVGTTKVVIVGGVNPANETLNRSWSTEIGSTWVNMSRENKTLDTLALGASIVYYDKSLLLIGKKTTKDSIQYKRSFDEGFSWLRPDSTNRVRVTDVHIYRPDSTNKVRFGDRFTPTVFPTMAVLHPIAKPDSINDASRLIEIERSNKLFIIGGKDANGKFSKEVWKGKKNKLNFLRQTAK